MAHRSSRYGTVENYLDLVNDNITVIVQIESRAAIDAVDEIAAVPGVDGLFVGPSDLAAAFARRGNPEHADVQAAIARVFERAAACGKPAGILAPVEADARRYMDMGATIVAVGSDLGVFRAGTKGLRERFRQDEPRKGRA
jgi:2-dehydro-3-deoxyglucarate aldolase